MAANYEQKIRRANQRLAEKDKYPVLTEMFKKFLLVSASETFYVDRYEVGGLDDSEVDGDKAVEGFQPSFGVNNWS